jgi:DNA-binding HxlR family transcriptional regulator
MEKIKSSPIRSYRQFCSFTRALDVVGDRWNLLIVRELLPGPLRYNDLKASLAGIATNLLAERLRSLEEHRIIERRLGDTGVLYALTPWGAELRETIEALARWGSPLMKTGRGGDSFQPRSLAVALPALLRGVTADPALELGLQVEGVLVILYIDLSGPRAVAQPDHLPDTVLTAAPEIVLGLAAGALTLDQAISAGRLQGDAEILRRVFPARR